MNFVDTSGNAKPDVRLVDSAAHEIVFCVFFVNFMVTSGTGNEKPDVSLVDSAAGWS